MAHGEGKFSLPYDEDQYNVVAKYATMNTPATRTVSDYSIAGLASADGRHLAMMPHLERAIFRGRMAAILLTVRTAIRLLHG